MNWKQNKKQISIQWKSQNTTCVREYGSLSLRLLLLGGGKHKGVIDSITEDLFDGSLLYIIKAKGGAMVPVREGAIKERPSVKK